MGRASRERRNRAQPVAQGMVSSMPKRVPPLEAVATAAQALAAAEEDLVAAIGRARAAGASWDQLMFLTSINRETLRRRYGP